MGIRQVIRESNVIYFRVMVFLFNIVAVVGVAFGVLYLARTISPWVAVVAAPFFVWVFVFTTVYAFDKGWV